MTVKDAIRANGAREKPHRFLGPSLSIYARLALISFLTLYLELVVIRWLAAEVRIFSYFKNFPLFAAFLGFGVGCILARSKRDYFRFAPLLLLIFSAVISLAHYGGYTHVTFADPYENYIIGRYSFENPMLSILKGSSIVLTIFILTFALFVALGEKVGGCLNESSPLPAYSVNVVFSLVGVLFYAWLSWAETGPALWMAVACLGLVPFFWRSWRVLAAGAAVLIPLALTPQSVLWSPYYRVEIEPLALRGDNGTTYQIGSNILVNYDGLTGAYNQSEEFVSTLPPDIRHKLLDYYNVSYRIFGPRFRKIMVLGAGGGNDIAAALRNGAETVDAVEIDPALVKIARRLHPEKVYDSEKVRVLIGDARTFLRSPSYSGYDMIVFGALDSHSVFSSMSSLRLDNYVYTVESFSQALERLAPQGILAVTFFAYKQWQLERVYNALWRANGTRPVVVRSLGEGSGNLVMLAGPGVDRTELLRHPYVIEHNAEDAVGYGTVEPTTDDWPFLYLRARGFPFSYAFMLALMLAFSYVVAVRAARASGSKFNGLMFLLGVGFMLLETKMLATIALLAGATWVINTLVISAVLVMILLANLAVMAGWFRTISYCVAALLGFILIDWCFRLNTVRLVPSATLNLYLVLVLLAMPVLFAGVLFARLYKLEDSPGTALGYNLFGAMCGGVLEYTSMAWGINSLNLLALFAYSRATLLAYRRLAAVGAAPGAAA